LIDGSLVREGDKLIGLASSGPHANGYSLIRKIIERNQASLDLVLDGKTLGDILLTPTRIYVKSLLALFKQLSIHAVAHITGGGLTENIPRVIPEGLDAQITLGSWQFPSVFDWLQSAGNVSQSDMLLTFNCGIGMVVCVAAEDEIQALAMLNELGETASTIGEIIRSEGKSKVVYR
jgi:phosphoribosylformylglycinamidine cyclo-ligase